VDDIPKSPIGQDSRGNEARQKIHKLGELLRLARNVERQRLPGSLKSSKVLDVFMSERKHERGLYSRPPADLVPAQA
jgi:hypothetical protein